MALIGYARVSTIDQDADLQLRDLETAGCERIFTDKASGKADDRPKLAAALDYLREGDTLVVWRLDRLGRSLQHLVRVVCELQAEGKEFRVLNGANIDTTTADGRLVFHIFCALAQFEADLISERTHAGLAVAKARGRSGGRPRALTDQQIQAARKLHATGEHSYSVIAATLGVSRSTLHRALAATSG